MRLVIVCLAGLLAVAAPALADPPAGSVRPLVPSLPPPPPAYDRPVARPGQFPTAPAANDPVEQQKRALYRSQLQGYQRDLANRPGPPAPGAGADALAARQELDRLRLQQPD